MSDTQTTQNTTPVVSTTSAEAASTPAADKLFTESEVQAAIKAAVDAAVADAAPKMAITFIPPYDGAKPDAIGTACITGAFAGRAIELSGIDLKLNKSGKIVVYMPGWGDKRGIQGAQEVLAEPIQTNSGTVYTRLSQNGAKDFGRFVNAVDAAYRALPPGDKFGVTRPFDF